LLVFGIYLAFVT